MKLVWSRLARDDRWAILDYIAADNPRAALALDDLFSRMASQLVVHPELGRPGRVAETRELPVHRNYLLIYDLKDDEVRILRVLHGARQWPPFEDMGENRDE